jgi:hypothetical protein
MLKKLIAIGIACWFAAIGCIWGAAYLMQSIPLGHWAHFPMIFTTMLVIGILIIIGGVLIRLGVDG